MMANLGHLVLFFVFLQYGESYRTDIDDEEAFCMYRKHLTFKPSSTCCAGKVVKPGIDIAKHWKDCSSSSGETLEAAAWAIYACIVKASAGGEKDEITLQEFSDLMTSSYTEEIKSKIDEEIKTVNALSASLTDSEKLGKIRATYYDIEMEVCEGMPTPSGSKSYGKVKPCSSWKEENHRAGMCCKRSYPVDIRYDTLMDLSSHCKPTYLASCKNKFHGKLLSLNVSEMMESNIIEICDLVCALIDDHNLPDFEREVLGNNEYWNLNALEILNKQLLPSYIPESLALEAKQFALSNFVLNDTIDEIVNYEFADVIPGDSNTFRSVHFVTYAKLGNYSAGENYKSEFMRRQFHKGIVHVPIICATYRKLLAEMERFFFQDCAPEGQETPPAEPEPNTVTEPEPNTVTEPEPNTVTEPETEAESQTEAAVAEESTSTEAQAAPEDDATSSTTPAAE